LEEETDMTIAEYAKVILGAIGGTTVLLAAAGWLGQTWIENKLRSSIQHEYDVKLAEFRAELAATDRISHDRWVMKRDVFLRTMKLIDAWWANIEWNHQPQSQQKPTIEEAREIHNQLALICEKDDVLKAFKTCFRMTSIEKTKPELSMDAIVDLRNAMRKELKFSETIPEDREASWIVEITMKE
jgi:hypothetical protein